MVKIKEAIVVEGRYDRNAISQIVEAPIFETNGFGIFKNKEQMALLRTVAQKRGLIVLTDSDSAGFVIRNHLKSAIPGAYLKHAYIPDIAGKEKRKAAPGKEGKLGVEGMRPEVILEALRACGATFDDETQDSPRAAITKQDFVELGLSGGTDSSVKRLCVQKALNLPEHTSANALLQALNLLMTADELRNLVTTLEKKNG